MELHMINMIYAALPMCEQTEKTTFSCKDDKCKTLHLYWGQGTCSLTKHTWRWTYSAFWYFFPACCQVHFVAFFILMTVKEASAEGRSFLDVVVIFLFLLTFRKNQFHIFGYMKICQHKHTKYSLFGDISKAIEFTMIDLCIVSVVKLATTASMVILVRTK